MGDVSFNGLAVVAAVALAAPLALGLSPKVRLPAIVLEIALGSLQRLGLLLAAPLGRLLRYRPTYGQAAPKTPTALGV